MSISTISGEKRIFLLQDAKELLPLIQTLTDTAVDEVNELVDKLDQLSETDPEFEEITHSIDEAVRKWAEKIQKLGCDVKGLWLVDFDNGQGYYCWAYPEDELDHFHGYEEGFAGRVRIC